MRFLGRHRAQSCVIAATAGLMALSPAHAAPPGPSAASAAEVTGNSVVFATYNVCKVTCAKGRFAWQRRRGAVVRNIAAAAPDVLATQELSFERTGDIFQWQDLQARLQRKGYTLVLPEQQNCSKGCTRGAHIFHRAGAIRPMPPPAGGAASGLVSLSSLTPGVNWAAVGDRGFSWALLQHGATGAGFLVVSVHLPNDKTRTGERARRASAAALAGWAERRTADWGLPGLPVVAMGDLNSFARRQPRGAQRVLARAGFTDAYSASTKVNSRFPTANYAFGADGWPARPPRFPAAAPRIDYVFARGLGPPQHHEVFLRLKKRGRFHPRYRGSDHNLVRAVWPMPLSQPAATD